MSNETKDSSNNSKAVVIAAMIGAAGAVIGALITAFFSSTNNMKIELPDQTHGSVEVNPELAKKNTSSFIRII